MDFGEKDLFEMFLKRKKNRLFMKTKLSLSIFSIPSIFGSKRFLHVYL